ncbi:MAG: RNA polymerase sigma-70 factor [Cyclobacteriaceae bacterium]|nr:RNA polymerase sigma-70 factor [Cyclobacteriaceae bacterium]
MINKSFPQYQADGFERVFEENFKRLFISLNRYAFTLVKDRDLARDAVQTVFIKWWEAKTDLSKENEAKRYLFTAVYRTSLNIIRNEKVKQQHIAAFVQERDSETKFHDTTEFEELDLKIKLTIESLPEQCRIIFCKSRFEDKKYGEIATDMNLSIKTVEAQMGKALKILREKLNNH